MKRLNLRKFKIYLPNPRKINLKLLNLNLKKVNNKLQHNPNLKKDQQLRLMPQKHKPKNPKKDLTKRRERSRTNPNDYN